MKTLLGLLLSLLSAAIASAQNTPMYFSSSVTLYDPTYGFKYELYNPGPATIYIDRIYVAAGFEVQSYAGYAFALVPEVAPQTGCTAYPILNEDLTDPGQQVVNGSTMQAQGQIHALPCPQGYKNTTLGCGSVSCVGFEDFTLAPGKPDYVYDRSSRPIPIPSGKALGLWGFSVANPYTAPMQGLLRITFHFHR
jgi:hypothetical protein